jgi:hypothetical protein
VTTKELEQMTFKYLPELFFRRLLKATFLACRLSWEDSLSRFAHPEAVNIQPFDKRARIEGYLRDVAEPFPGVTAHVAREPEHNWWYHTEIHAGPVILTANSVPVPCAPVDRAEFRSALARVNWQLSLLDDEPPADDAPLYALYLHSKFRSEDPDEYAKYKHLPGSAYLAFPDAQLEGYVHTINLFDTFPDVLADELPQEWDDEARLRYRRRARRGGSEWRGERMDFFRRGFERRGRFGA